MRLVKNPLYWDADRVAFRTIDVLAIESYSTMLNLYLMGELDWIERYGHPFPVFRKREG